MKREHISGSEFIALARMIIGNNAKYSDELMEICVEGDHIEVTRKPMPNVAEHLRVSNPVTMADGDNVYRHHGEHCYLTEHMRSLCG